MAQTLDNGIVVPINSDNWNLTPDLATMGNKTNAVTYCPDVAARDALTKFTGRAAWVASTGILQVWNGTRWQVASITQIGHTYAAPGTLAGVAYATVASMSVTTLGGSVNLDYAAIMTNGNSGENRTMDIEWYVDGAQAVTGNTFEVPHFAGRQVSVSGSMKRKVSMSAGAHTIDLRTRASVAGAVYNTAFAITASENPV